MHQELGEVQRRFASVPLFDQALAHELAALERRSTSTAPQVGPNSRSSQGRSGARPEWNNLSSGTFRDPTEASSPSPAPGGVYQQQRGGAQTTFRLPEKIQRPWSVEVLLHRGEAITQSQSHPQAHRFLSYPSEDQHQYLRNQVVRGTKPARLSRFPCTLRSVPCWT